MVGAGFGFIGGSFPVMDDFFNGTVGAQARHLEVVTGAAGGFWSEHVREMVSHGIEPLRVWPAPPR